MEMNMHKENRFAKALGCSNMREVCEKAASWNFNLTEDQHLIRSAILSLHANVEGMLKHILFHHMVRLVNEEVYEQEDEPYIQALANNIKSLSFGTLLQLLKPCLDAADSTAFERLRAINRVRNDVAHRDPGQASYKGRNPFTDYDAFAELLSDTMDAHGELGEFFIQRIGLPPDGLLREI
jgi:hypothetical protein